MQRLFPFLIPFLAALPLLPGQTTQVAPAKDHPLVRAGKMKSPFILDGLLNDRDWQNAPAIKNLTTIDPVEGAIPQGRTEVKILANADYLIFGFRCEDPDPGGIVSRTVARDTYLGHEDHIKILLGTFADGRSGYIFAVNPLGARYDALVAHRGEGENRNWDGLWEAKSRIQSFGWTAEIRIPVTTLSFKEGQSAWDFNIQRRIERLQETSRWACPRRDFKITHVSRAGRLADLPPFKLGLGLNIRPVGVGYYGKEEKGERAKWDGDLSLDISWKITPELTAALTINTDFAETEVDTRRTNLTRFPTYFPEKRSFFLEGAEAFDFGLGLSPEIRPFHSRRIGLVSEEEVPLQVGTKVIGRLGSTHVGAIAVKTDEKRGVAPHAEMGVIRLKQDILDESTIGLIATTGDPLDRNSWMAGGDFTYQTSNFMGDKNFLVGLWGVTMDREDLGGGSRSAFGCKVDYPNDLWDIAFMYKRIGEDFDPSLGFVPRTGINKYVFKGDFSPRPKADWLRKTSHEFYFSHITNLDNELESYLFRLTPLQLDLETGDNIELIAKLRGERITTAFEVSDGVNILPDDYDWVSFGIELETAPKRALQGEFNWYTGPFYDGTMNTISGTLIWNPLPLITLEAIAETNQGRLPQGNFVEDIYATNLRFNFSPDLNWSCYLQYDTDSESLGINTRLRWTVTKESDIFFVYNYNLVKDGPHLDTDTYETIFKAQYSLLF